MSLSRMTGVGPVRNAYLLACLCAAITLSSGCLFRPVDKAAIHPRDDVAAMRQLPAEPAEPLAPAVEIGESFLDPDELQPWEDVSDSPLDTLAVVDAELTEAAREVENERIAEADDAPEPVSYDYPIVINDDVLFWLDYYGGKHRRSFIPGMRRSGRYMEMIRRTFAEEGVPLDLIPMAHVESAFKTNAYSRARAMGIFQFIAATGRRYDLKIDYWVDERRDPEKAARAAARYMKDLHGMFDDWLLALAAYNAGEGRVRRALARTGADNFWDIRSELRRETRNYVPAIIAASMIYKNPVEYDIHFEPDDEVVYDTIAVEGAVDLQVLANCAGSDFNTLDRLNPMLRRAQTPPGATTDVRVPAGTGVQTMAALSNIPQSERVLYVTHKVGDGDTLYDLARDYGVSVGAIQQANNLGKRTVIRLGSELTIPTVAAGRYSSDRHPARSAYVDYGGAPVTHRVRSGETLSHIARRYGTTPAAIAAASEIDVHQLLQIGQRLKVVPGARSRAAARKATGGGKVDGNRHRVRSGESLWVIARRYSTTVDRLCSLNQLSKSAVLYPGMVLTVAP